MSEPLGPAELSALAEGMDAAAWADCVRAATPAMREDLGITLLHSGDFVAGAVACADVLALNRVVGLGMAEAADAEQLDALVAAYRAVGSARMTVQLAPHAEPRDLRARLEERGFQRHNAWVKLVRDAHLEIPEADTDLRIEPIGSEHAARFGDIVANGFGWPEPLAHWVRAVHGRRDWRFFGAFDEDRLIATGGMFLRGESAWFGFAATTPEGRRRGGQSALIARRLHEAVTAGCDWIILETAEDLPRRPNPSLHNVRRFGFEVAYIRPNFVLPLRG